MLHNDSGKLPYDIRLRAPEVRKKKPQSFHEAAAESFGSGSSTGSKYSRASVSRSEEMHSKNSTHGDGKDVEEEVQSLLKQQSQRAADGSREEADTGRQLFQSQKGETQSVQRKRKAKGSGGSSALAPDLNLPVIDTSALVPTGIVLERVNKLDKSGGEVGVTASASEALPKKQRRSRSQSHARSAAAADGSPRQAQ